MRGKRDVDSSGGTELSRALSALRARSGLPQTAVAAAVEGLSQAELSRIENARSVPDPNGLLPRLLTALDASPAERDRILEMARSARRAIIPARTILESGTAHFQARIRDIEDQSVLVRGFHPTTVLGLLQTEAYIRAVFTGHVGQDELEASVTARLARSRALLDGSDRRWILVHTEGALRWNLPGPAVMAEQLDHIAAMAQASERLRVGIIPWQATTRVQPLHGFHIYDFADRRYRRDPRMVLVGTHSGTALLGETDSERYVTLFEQLTEHAVFDHAAADLARKIAEDYRRLPDDPN